MQKGVFKNFRMKYNDVHNSIEMASVASISLI